MVLQRVRLVMGSRGDESKMLEVADWPVIRFVYLRGDDRHISSSV